MGLHILLSGAAVGLLIGLTGGSPLTPLVILVLGVRRRRSAS